MESSSWWSIAQYAIFIAIVGLLVKPVGAFIAQVFQGQLTFLDFAARPLEKLVYKIARVDEKREMTWREYAVSFVLFSIFGTIALFLLLETQAILPFFSLTKDFLTTPMTWDLAFNTAISFATTTTWQSYGGETTMSYFAQIAGLTVQNFLAGAAGLAIGIAFIRGFKREKSATLGNFWVDLTRGLLWILLPLSFLGSLLLIWQGVPVNFSDYTQVTTIEGAAQTIAQGPFAVLEFIKNLGANGGGFFNTNAAHPFENPTPLSNFIEVFAIVILPASLTYTFGAMLNRRRQGWLFFWVMTVLFVGGIIFAHWAEQRGNPLVAEAIHQNSAPNTEGKETRFGIGGSMLAGRFGLAIPALALAGAFAAQGRRVVTLGTLPTDSFAFGIFLAGTAIIVGALSYFPALALGAILEHLTLFK